MEEEEGRGKREEKGKKENGKGKREEGRKKKKEKKIVPAERFKGGEVRKNPLIFYYYFLF